MAPNSRVIICRHSQATHNVAEDYSLPDAPLTQLGRQQAAKLPEFAASLQGEVDLIITSALKRTLQTTLLGWGPAMKRLGQQNVICLPQLQGEFVAIRHRQTEFELFALTIMRTIFNVSACTLHRM